MKRDTITNIPAQELAVQSGFIRKIFDINAINRDKTGVSRSFFISTFGCQMNAHDSEKLAGMLWQMGYVEAEEEKQADIVIYNTCCVRENAENKVYGNLGYLKHVKETRPDFKIVLCGCMMQQDTVIDKIKKSYRHIDVIFGTYNLYRFPELLFANFETNSLIIDIWKEHREIIEDLPSERKYPFKSSVNIMFGCNNFCTYCIVPYVRGRERSREANDIMREIEALAKDGVKEIMLLGQNVNSYGKTLAEEVTFAQLLKKIAGIEGIKRIRFMTSHPKDLSDELISVIKDDDKICNYIHLPFQAGSTAVLNKMNRKYTKEQYLELIEKIKNEIPDVSITTDIIVGFPGETDEDFEDTIDVVKKVRYNGAFTFIYSKRTGTPAAAMTGQIPEDVVKTRFNRLLEILNPIVLEKNQEHIGKTYDVLVEEVSGGNGDYLTGRTDGNSIVHFAVSKDYIGEIIKIKITGCKTFYLTGEIAE